jgi:hypothetical protein
MQVGTKMRRNQRHHDAAKIKEINHTTFKKEDKDWIQCYICKDWLWEETYYKVDWNIGPSEFYERDYSIEGYRPTFHICNSCCNTKLAVVDYLDELTEKNSVSYKKSFKAWEKKEKKKQKDAMCIVDGKSYSFTFKEEK